MRKNRVALLEPALNLLTDVVESEKRPDTDHTGSVNPVEALDERVFGGECRAACTPARHHLALFIGH